MIDPAATPDAPLWRVAVDTGGTFTDCIAQPTGARPGQDVRRVKVLSTSALRCRVVEGRRRGEGSAMRIAAPWSAPDGFLDGVRWSELGAAGNAPTSGRVSQSRGDGWLELVGGDAPPRGAAVELRFDLESPLLAVHLALGVPPSTPLPPVELRLATTRGTNALLERRGARVALFVTAGLQDLLAIGDQRRNDLFARAPTRPPPLYEWVFEVDERLAADGAVVRPIGRDALESLEETARRALAEGAEVAAVALLHAYRNPEHEQVVASTLRRAGFSSVIRSADLARLQRIVPRAETAVVEAYLVPALGQYLSRIKAGLGRRSSLAVMTSAGGLVSAVSFRAVDGLLSGPAGGVAGVAAAARRVGVEGVLAFDMGGTSTDATRWSGDFAYRFESRVGDAVVLAPCLQIETVAAGGGSICAFDGDRLTVGPQSAGAQPGPACYGAGGPLTLTDVNLLLGRLWPDRFEVPLDRDASEAALQPILDRLPATPRANLLAAFLEIANERMAGAIRAVSVREGYDPADFALLSFGGAGGQHACALATLLGIDRVLVPGDASLLSARGLLAARRERFAEEQVLERLGSGGPLLEIRWRRLADRAHELLVVDGVPRAMQRVVRRIAALRLEGQESTLTIEARGHGDDELAGAFRLAYRDAYGYEPPARPIELESLRVVVREQEADPRLDASSPAIAAPPPAQRITAWTGNRWNEVPLVWRDVLAPGERVAGPALLVERWSVTWLDRGWRVEVLATGDLLLTRR